MLSLDMGKPSYPLTREKISEIITQKRPGNYALSYSDEGKFIVNYVGRADSDVGGRLKDHINEGYERFKFSYATSPKDAFEKECRNYHDFGGDEGKLENERHPDSPDGIKRSCRICGE